MTASTITKIIAGVITTGSIGSAVAYGIYEFNRETIGDKLKNTLLIKNSEDAEKWRNRVATLKSDKSALTNELSRIKNAGEDISNIQAWCENNLKNKFSSQEDQLFKEIQKYCVYNIKEKAGDVADISKWNSDSHDKKLKAADVQKISTTMKKIKEELQKTSNPDKDALKKWCEKAYQNPFKGEKDQDYLDTKEYCANSQ